MVQERAEALVKHLAKAEPLRNPTCQREDCFSCSTGGNGRCQKNGAGYRIELARGLKSQPFMKRRHCLIGTQEE